MKNRDCVRHITAEKTTLNFEGNYFARPTAFEGPLASLNFLCLVLQPVTCSAMHCFLVHGREFLGCFPHFSCQLQRPDLNYDIVVLSCKNIILSCLPKKFQRQKDCWNVNAEMESNRTPSLMIWLWLKSLLECLTRLIAYIQRNQRKSLSEKTQRSFAFA